MREREGGREGERERGREGGRKGGREGGRERGREGEREGERVFGSMVLTRECFQLVVSRTQEVGKTASKYTAGKREMCRKFG